MPTWLKVVLIVFVLPTLIGGVVLLVAGRPLAFEILHRRIAKRFPEVRWIKTDELATWRPDSSQSQLLLLDARTAIEYDVSRIKGAVQIDPYRPSLRPLRGVPKEAPIVVYSSAGYRGARLAGWLGRMGYSNVRNLDGGVFAWANQGRPVFRGDTPTALVHPYNRLWGYLLAADYRIDAPDLEKRSAAP
jgi:rhodanese-related sulfurtransferase